MTRTRTIRIRALTLAIAATFAFSPQIASAKTKTNPQGLWVGGDKYFSEFQGKALTTSGMPRANLAFGSSFYFSPISIAFDGHENFWAVFTGINDNLPAPALELNRADLASLKAGKPVKATVIISRKGNSSVPFVVPESIGFDAAGDLWVIDGGQKLIELTADQIKTSGAPTPKISITSADATPSALRFDASDNLWVAEFPLPFNPSNPIQLWRFSAAERASSGSASPGLMVNLPDLFFFVDFAFDSSGNLWIAGPGSHGDALEMISASNLTGTGEISPPAAVTITSSAFGVLIGSGSCLGGIDFDASGDLWASVGTNNADCDGNTATEVVAFTPAQLGTGGNLTPSVIIGQNKRETNLFLPGPLRFGPAVK
jgi:hypothetical protein